MAVADEILAGSSDEFCCGELGCDGELTSLGPAIKGFKTERQDQSFNWDLR